MASNILKEIPTWLTKHTYPLSLAKVKRQRSTVRLMVGHLDLPMEDGVLGTWEPSRSRKHKKTQQHFR